MPVKMSNNAYAEKLIQENLEYFTSKVEGTNYFRKIIINSNAKSNDMTSVARFANSVGMNAMVFNMYGVKTYVPGNPVQTFRIKGRRFNELLFEIYKTLNLENKPLIIIGRRKVDRGLGFHYAPRDGAEGLIWTDIILGRIEDKNTAVQKAGRLAGIIAQCPQYYRKCTYWTDERTQNDILRHNKIVDEANKITGCTALQAVTRGTVKVNEILPEFVKAEKPKPEPKKPRVKVNKDAKIDNYRVFTSEDILKKACNIMGYKYIVTKDKTPDGFLETSLNSKKAVVLLDDAIHKVKSAYGTNSGKTSYRTFYPCYRSLDDPNSLSYVFIIRPKGEDESIEQYNAKIQKMDLECV
jgi:hypothetical protein